MKVKDLIKKLKKMPPSLVVYYSHHDNSEWEVAGETCGVDHMIKEDLREIAEVGMLERDRAWFESNDDEWVIITG